jgi:hypothetical protein
MRRPPRASRRSRSRMSATAESDIAPRGIVVLITSGATVASHSVRVLQMWSQSLSGWSMRSQRNRVNGRSGPSLLPPDGPPCRSPPARTNVQRVRAAVVQAIIPTDKGAQIRRALQVLGSIRVVVTLEPGSEPRPGPMQPDPCRSFADADPRRHVLAREALDVGGPQNGGLVLRDCAWLSALRTTSMAAALLTT